MPESPSFAALSLSEFGARLASAEPVPGGGSAAAVVASIAASLVAMVARLSQDRPRYAEHAALHGHAVDMADGLRRQFLSL
ncbi:MAG TPA: cyclodeaminase/cyclohydrolase family protein, partial [Candidatus Limnocylindrales bacterium]|nr:cyclodeaminase/cyclohydrolase family protein [Candidatus Limnocylindrales bacterium]